MLHTPPRHSIEAAAGTSSVLVVRGDPSWDQDRIAREAKEHFGGDEKAHPVGRYRSGESRFDLDAEYDVGGEKVTIRDYLNGKPSEFRLRRMDIEDVAKVHDWMRGTGTRIIGQAAEHCCKMGIIGVKNLAIDWLTDNGEVSDHTLKQIYDCGTTDQKGSGMELIQEIGVSVLNLSAPLSYVEKKP